ncbi:ATP-dependent endonuclease [Streptomyces sp. AP-93]|uniref:ATP-dependent nuclease n=1 Tax=Streptomyces sp. AP-93 TaxID=2929048 RepID=UPI001FAE82D3|nr:AAA family ATPase [Streptomyces sp. AP-93]MCJ0875855.1 AAA family ATPase [Streptomyces sp. AP-93]
MSSNRVPITASPLTSDWNTVRYSDRGWPQFLDSITISGLRGWRGETVEFRFPVTAIAGENGAGKSTVLKAAAAAYGASGVTDKMRVFYPDDFFPNTPWEQVEKVNLVYQFHQGVSSYTLSLRKPSKRWRGMPERAGRSVFFLDISRTQPIDTLIGYGKIAKQSTFRGDETEFPDADRNMLARIMNKSYVAGRMAKYEQKQIGILSTPEGEYSNFHQGAGEDTTTDLVTLLRAAPRNSLVVIDEIESSLHPRAQRRLMAELFSIAHSQRIQFILSTHSPYILEQLPTEARIYIQLERGGMRDVIYGVTPEFAMSLMDDVDHTELTLYCEDKEAAVMVEALISYERPDLRRRITITPVGPASTVKTLGRLAQDNKLPGRSVAVLDADQGEAVGCIRLPGTIAPEREVFQNPDEDYWDAVAQRLGVRAGDLLDAVEDAKHLENHHAWSRRVAENLGPRVRTDRVWEDAVSVWAQSVVGESERAEFAEKISDLLS